MESESLSIFGLSPEGLRKRLESCSLSVAGLRFISSAYGTHVHTDSSQKSRGLQDLKECCAPFSADVQTNPAVLLVQSAKKRGTMMVFTESCTGGMAGSLLTAVAGSSEVFWGSMVTYANEAKEKVLGVSSLSDHGAVSEATVKDMVDGAILLSGADVALAISGIAGPGGGTPEKPVGTVWFAFRCQEHMQTLNCVFSGNRSQIRRKAAALALMGLANQIKGALLDISWIADYTCY